MPIAEIIAIGTELLLGEIQDTNTRYLARVLKDAGIDLFRAVIIGDNPSRIAQAIQDALQRADIVITTGGLGPTVDDPTRQAVAQAVGVDVEYRPELWEQIEARFARYGRKATENNRRQAFIPVGAQAIENPVGTAPAFLVETGQKVIISVPGVPREMEHLIENNAMPYLRQKFVLNGTIRSSVIHTAGIGESQVDELIGDLEQLSNPTVGLAAHPGQVDIRITAKASSPQEAARMIETVAAQVKDRLGVNIYGLDDTTLESVFQELVVQRQWKLAIMEYGLNGALFKRISDHFKLQDALISEETLAADELAFGLSKFMMRSEATAGLAASLEKQTDRQVLSIVVMTPEGQNSTTRSYGGPPGNAQSWAVNTSLDYVRRLVVRETNANS